jgi:threonine synthase
VKSVRFRAISWTAPEAAALVSTLQRLRDARAVTREAEIVLVFTGAGIKNDPPPLPAPLESRSQ